jgi:beta-glucosidase
MRMEPLYPFGFGLTYSFFAFDGCILSSPVISSGETVKVKTKLHNKGSRDSGQVVQVYIEKEVKTASDPNFSLKAFKRVFVKAGKAADLDFVLESRDFETVDESGNYILVPGKYRITIADCSPFKSAQQKGAVIPVSEVIEVQ